MATKFKIYLKLFYLGTWLNNKKLPNIFVLPVSYLYNIYGEFFLGIEIPLKVRIGRGLSIYHGYGTVVSSSAIIGDNCVLRQGITIGEKTINCNDCPTLGDRVDIGAGAVVIGRISIGNDVKIGANSVVLKSVPDGAVVAGNPAKIISHEAK